MRILLATIAFAAILPLSSAAFAGGQQSQGGEIFIEHGSGDSNGPEPFDRSSPGYDNYYDAGPRLGYDRGPSTGYTPQFQPQPYVSQDRTTAGRVLSYSPRSDRLTLTNGERFVLSGAAAGAALHRGEHVDVTWHAARGERIATDIAG